MTIRAKKRMAIIASYFAGETYGLLGPQMAATVIQENTPYDCIVIAVAREDDKALLKKALADYFGQERPIIGFSTLSGRDDLFSFAKDLKDEGAVTILGGPQADVDYLGEKGWRDHPHRFRGLSANFTFSLHGPAEQIIHFLQDPGGKGWQDTTGLLYLREDADVIQNQKKVWEERFLGKVRWDNIYRVGKAGLIPLKISTGQVLQQIGCPYAARESWVEIDYPVSLPVNDGQKVKLLLKGCSFCDVAVDKGFYGELDIETVLDQIRCLPEWGEGRKIPFELINENPLPGLPRLLRGIREKGLKPSQINLILRADWFLRGQEALKETLRLARSMGVCILLASVGLESFDDLILRNLNKGLNVETNLQAVRLMRQLKKEFPQEWGYSRQEGAIHGFIHPTPWDTKETSANIHRVLLQYVLPADILPEHSTPLIVHHASGLGDWIREVEGREGVKFTRYGSIIGWWQQEKK
ncbi:MAG: radical SAM protein [Deltaproteobacteria bacterium]|nr:radical SAM protein [Deltaproteobacteria bacterium]